MTDPIEEVIVVARRKDYGGVSVPVVPAVPVLEPEHITTGIRQYLRKISLVVTGGGKSIELSALRTVFHVRRGDFQNPNTADVRVYNVADITSNSIVSNQQIILQAGYKGNYGLIFQGTIKQVRRGRDDQKDTYLDITAADGDEAYNYSTTAFSMAAGTRPENILQAFIANMTIEGISPGYMPQLNQNGSIRGRVHFGMTRDEMRLFAEQNGCSWSIQDKQAVLIPKLSYIPGDVPVIAVDSGLIGVPEQTDQGIQMRVLLNPRMKIGQPVKLDNKSAINRYRYGTDALTSANVTGLAESIKVNAEGLYYVMIAEHSGDTRGEEWYTDLICLAIDATVPFSAAPQGAIQDAAASIARDG